jgi:hypothetical protein
MVDDRQPVRRPDRLVAGTGLEQHGLRLAARCLRSAQTADRRQHQPAARHLARRARQRSACARPGVVRLPAAGFRSTAALAHKQRNPGYVPVSRPGRDRPADQLDGAGPRRAHQEDLAVPGGDTRQRLAVAGACHPDAAYLRQRRGRRGGGGKARPHAIPHDRNALFRGRRRTGPAWRRRSGPRPGATTSRQGRL